MDKRETAHRVSEARRLLDEPLLNEALNRIENAAIEGLICTPIWEPEWEHEKHRQFIERILVVRTMRQLIEQVIIAGDAALAAPRRVA